MGRKPMNDRGMNPEPEKGIVRRPDNLDDIDLVSSEP